MLPSVASIASKALKGYSYYCRESRFFAIRRSLVRRKCDEEAMASITERRTRNGLHYRVEIRIKGAKPVVETFARKTDAKRWAEQTEAAIRERRYFKTSESLKHTFAEMVERYIEFELPKRHSDHKKIEMHLNWWKSHLGHYYLADVTPQLIAQYRDVLSNETFKKGKKEDAKVKRREPATIKFYLASLSMAYNAAVKEWGWVDENPIYKVSMPKVDNGRVRFLSKDEREKLLEVCSKSTNPYLYSVVMLALCTGMRWTEVTGLKWREIDTQKNVIRLETTKNKERRAIPMAPPAIAEVKKMQKRRMLGSPYVFPRADGQAPMEIRKHWEKAVRDAKLDNFTFHDLRHTAASYLAMSGATLTEISHILGHKTLQMVKRYSHLSEQHTAKVLNRMASVHLKEETKKSKK